MERTVAEDDDAVRVADHRVGAELREFGDPGKTVFINLVPEMDRALGPRAECDHEREEVDGKIGPGRGLDFREEIGGERHLDHEFLAAAHEGGVTLVLDDDAEFGERAGDEIEVGREGFVHPDFAAGDGAEGEEGDNFVVVAADGDGGAVEFFHAGDFEARGAEAFDLRAHGDEGGAEILHMRLAGGVDEGGTALGEGGGHGEIFRDGDRHVVEPVARAAKAGGQGDDERVALVDRGPEGAEDVEVRVDFAHAERAALGVGVDRDFAQAVEQGGIEQHRRTHVLREFVIGEGVAKRGVVHAHEALLTVPLDLRTLGAEEGDEFVEVGDVRDVFQRDGLVGEQGRAENGQHGVLVAGGRDGAGEGLAAVDDEVGHQSEKLRAES